MRKKKNLKPAVYAALVFCCLCTLVPCVLIVITSLRTTGEIVRDGLFGNITTLHWENYIEAWKVGHFSTYFLNSIFITFFSVLGVLLFSLIGAYAMAVLNFKGKGIYKTLIVMGLVIPCEIIVIPLFYDMQSMGLMDTHWAVILPTVAMNIPFGTFLLSGFIKDIPKSLLESARMDGASEWRTLWKIVMPIIKPALISLLIFIFMWTWNDFMLPNIMIRSQEMRTLPLGLDYFRGKNTQNIPLIASASNIIALPVIIIYLVFQKNLIKGMMVGAVKG
ncbi:MAG: carbohydrate ABC transporter permease [Clostridiales bacterium]|nr:carbohydrate ABC transporter permease [Clostridiales bacterium]MDY3748060.1 carbohydrate ABC transporter permease [Lachnospiraceae bacterium]